MTDALDTDGRLDIAAIEARVNAATKGPWDAPSSVNPSLIERAKEEFVAQTSGSIIIVRAADGRTIAYVASTAETLSEDFDNAEFLAHAITDIPALLFALKRSEEVREELVRALEVCLEQAEGCAANHYGENPEGGIGEHITNARAALSRAKAGDPS